MDIRTKKQKREDRFQEDWGRMELEDTVVIMFPGGTYGKYLYWILNNFTERGLQNDTIFKPNASGSAHEQIINELEPDMSNCDKGQWQIYKDSKKFIPFFARHLIEDSKDFNANPMEELHDVSTSVKKVLLIQSSTYLQNFNNVAEKTFSTPIEYYKSQNRFEDFRVDVTKRDQVREMLSYKLFHFESRKPLIHNYNNVFNINLDDFLFSFYDILPEIVEFLETKLTVSLDDLLDNHMPMMSAQKHLHKDKEVQEFLDNFKQGKGCSLPKNCSIIDEAYIQKYLRDELDLEIKCHNLLIFPETVSELQAITYPKSELKC